jgi:hypothetical protein
MPRTMLGSPLIRLMDEGLLPGRPGCHRAERDNSGKGNNFERGQHLDVSCIEARVCLITQETRAHPNHSWGSRQGDRMAGMDD